MRVDLFLHRIRLAKSRTLAQTLVEGGHVRIDGRRAERASAVVREGSVLAMPLHGRVLMVSGRVSFEVITLPERRGPPAEARSCYREIDEGGGPT